MSLFCLHYLLWINKQLLQELMRNNLFLKTSQQNACSKSINGEMEKNTLLTLAKKVAGRRYSEYSIIASPPDHKFCCNYWIVANIEYAIIEYSLYTLLDTPFPMHPSLVHLWFTNNAIYCLIEVLRLNFNKYKLCKRKYIIKILSITQF